MSSASSFDVVSSRSRSSTTASDIYFDDSDDEIVWGVSDGSLSSSESDVSANGSTFPASDDDFVVLSRPRSPRVSTARVPPPVPSNGADTPNTTTLASDLARLSVNEVSSIIRRNKKAAAAAATAAAKQNPGAAPPKYTNKKKKQTQTSQSPVSDRPSSVATLRKGSPSGKAGRRRRKNENKSGSPEPDSGFGARPIVDDISEHPDSASEGGDDEFTSMYDAAASYINSCLADPSSVCRLTLLQALIIELGLASSSLPASLTAAKAIIKSRVFLNVGEYLDARRKGPAAVQEVMHKSKSSLIRDLRKKRNPISLQWVKETGLQVLLVSCYHH
ncbi:hypothetical protein B0H19DRAFT_1211961 [Mycena capillaripes]|nr:hypothetical protein B0H19DRAFT_1211961 [Mycena capillaripes]